MFTGIIEELGEVVSLERNGRIQPGRAQPVDTRIAVHELEPCAEIPGSEEMLERLALAPAPDQFPQGRQFFFGQNPFELEIELDPFPLQRMREQMFRV